MFDLTGTSLALIEVGFIFSFSYILRHLNWKQLSPLNKILYGWTMFTLSTGIWELMFLIQYKTTCNTALTYINSNEHVWTKKYDIIYLLPWKFSNIFYAEYGAYADREYMIPTDDWSRIIEGSHAIMCGLFAGLSILFKIYNKTSHYLVSISMCMGAQLMNSVLYMVNYFHETRDKENINYNTVDFPTGKFLEKRPFMYINIFWTIMPIFCVYNLLKTYYII